MKGIGACALAIGIAAVSSAGAAGTSAGAADCPTRMPDIRVAEATHRMVEDHRRSRAEIARVRGGDERHYRHLERRLKARGYRVQGTPGITEFELGTNYRVEFATIHRGNELCMQLTGIEIDLTGTSTVAIAREHRPGTCEHRVAFEHEMAHVRVNREFVAALAAPFRADIRRAMRPLSLSGRPADAQRLSARLADEAGKTVRRAVDAAMKRLSRRQTAIDTEAEYLRVSEACGNW